MPIDEFDDWGSTPYTPPRPIDDDWLEEEKPRPVPPWGAGYASMPPENKESTERSRKWRKIAKALGALVTASTVVIGGFLTITDKGEAQQDSISAAHRVLDPVDYELPTIGEVEASYREDIAKACQSLDNPEEATQIATEFYEKAFLSGLDQDNVDFETAQSSLDDAINEYESARQNLTWHDFSPEIKERFDKLSESIEGPDNYDISEYKSLIDDYLGPLGIEAVFDWEEIQDFQKAWDAGVPDTGFARPISPTNQNTGDVKEAIIGVIKAINQTPREMLEMQKLKKIFIGKMEAGYAGGVQAKKSLFFTSASKYMVLGVNNERDYAQGAMGVDQHEETTFHEGVHMSTYHSIMSCFWQGNDSVWRRQNPVGFNYLVDGKRVKVKFTPLDGSGGVNKVNTVMSEYGGTHPDEDVATTMGAVVDDPTQLFDGTGEGKDGRVNNRAIFAKIAAWVATIENPAVRNYLAMRLHLALIAGQIKSSQLSREAEGAVNLGRAYDILHSTR